MKNKKGFISISIIYSFFIVFLLILVLIMTTYMNNRYSFNIYTKDIKRDHANKTQVVTNKNKSISYEDDGHPYYSGYYYLGGNGNLINYYYYSKGLSTNTTAGIYGTNKDMSENQVFNFYIYLGSTSEHTLSNVSFFDANSTHMKALNSLSSLANNKIVIVPELNNKYVNWNLAMQDDAGFTDINTKLINSIGSQLVKIPEGTADFKTLCSNKNCKIHIRYIGYEDGADGVFRYMTHSSTASYYTNSKFFMINSGTICNSTKCDMTTAEKTNFASRVSSSGIVYGYGTNSSTDVTKNYYSRMNDLKTTLGATNYSLTNMTTGSITTPEARIADIINNY